ncbi:MAG: hypothetical protein ACYDEJ_16650 [Desulfitobacteriaceae bacterium]
MLQSRERRHDPNLTSIEGISANTKASWSNGWCSVKIDEKWGRNTILNKSPVRLLGFAVDFQ